LFQKLKQLKKNTNYRGPQDEIHGDSYNEGVRKAAKDALDAIFSRLNGLQSDRSNFRSDSFSDGNKNINYVEDDNYYKNSETLSDYNDKNFNNYNNSNNYNTGFNGYNDKMKGFGNPNFDTKKVETNEGWIEWSKNKVSNGISTGIKKLTGKGDDSVNNNTFQRNYQVDGNKYPNFKQHEIGKDNYKSQQIYVETEEDEEYIQKKKKDEKIKELKKEIEEEEVEEVNIETTIVNDLTNTSGIKRNSPSKQQLKEFVQRSLNVDLNLICELLEEKLESNNWVKKLRALYGIEALIIEKKKWYLFINTLKKKNHNSILKRVKK